MRASAGDVDMSNTSAGALDRGFWWIFGVAWAGYVGLVATVATTVEGAPLNAVLLPLLATTAPQMALSALIGLRRRSLLRPEWPLARTVALHAAVGLGFAVVSGTLGTLCFRLVRGSTELRDTAELFDYGVVGQSVQGLFMYIMFAGFMMWSESVRRFHEGREALAREAMLRAQAEAKAIRAQFNPHFVFNTLHSLMLLVRADPAAAERAIEDVGELIRYASTLQRREVDHVPLFKELEVVRRYLALERLRLDQRLHVVWDVEEGLDDHSVPAFGIQTLVENAIKHGLEPAAEGGTITVCVERDGTGLRVTVSDDGAGADGPAAQGQATPGHGLDLLSRRLAALHGADASLRWGAVDGGGFSATVRVP